MTVEQARALRPVFEAYCEGKVLQTRLKQGFAGPPWTEWKIWDGKGEFGQEEVEWRVSPEPREWWLCPECSSVMGGPIRPEHHWTQGQKCPHVLVKVKEAME